MLLIICILNEANSILTQVYDFVKFFSYAVKEQLHKLAKLKKLKQMEVPFTQHYSRQIHKSDYAKFDYILAMDDNNVRDILIIVGGDKNHKVYRLLDFTQNPHSVKDLWYTGNFDNYN